MIKLKKYMVNPFEENTYILSDETGEAVIIDCGVFYSKERRRLLEYIEREHLTPVRLLLTHAHHDHLYGNDLIYKYFGLLPEVHEADRWLMTEQLPKRITEIFDDKYPFDIPMPAEHYLATGDLIRFGDHRLTVIHTPGHTHGSVFFYCETEKIAFSGDTLFFEDAGRTDLPGGDHEQLKTSLRYITNLLPDDTVLHPGHDRKTTIGYEKKNNPYLF